MVSANKNDSVLSKVAHLDLDQKHEMILRKVTAGDVDTLFDIRCSVVENFQSKEELAELGITRETITEMICDGNYVAYLAEVDNIPVGFTMAEISEGYVFACFVRPAYERKGVGRALMEKTEAELRHLGVTQAWLSTGSDENLRAIGFYSRLGWKRTGFLEDGQIRFEKNLINVEQGNVGNADKPRA